MLLLNFPAPLHRLGLRAAHGLRRRWWRWFRPRLSGVRVVALDGRGTVLLVRHSYGSPNWTLPGGGLRHGEDPLIAACRELSEEAGCRLLVPVQVEVAAEEIGGARVQNHIVVGRIDGAIRADGREVIAARRFALDALPDDLPLSLRRRLPGWVEGAGTQVGA